MLDFPLPGPSWDTIHPVTEPSLPLAMHPSEHSRRQLDEAYLQSLDLEALRNLSAGMLADLKDARAQLDARPAGHSRSPLRPTPSEYARNRAALAEFIETCRQRGQDPWRTLERAIADRRVGCPLARSSAGPSYFGGVNGSQALTCFPALDRFRAYFTS